MPVLAKLNAFSSCEGVEKSSHDTLDSFLRQLEAEELYLIREYERIRMEMDLKISLVRKKRNLLVPPIHRLHNELLSTIFYFSTGDGCGQSRLMQVCSLWRELCLRIPQIWNTITPKTLTVAHRILFLSKCAPLYVYLNDPRKRVSPQTSFDFACTLSPDIWRCRSLSVSLSVPSTLALIPALQRPATQLRELVLRPLKGTERADVKLYLLGNEAPQLRHLELHQILAPWNSTIFRGLKKLRLVDHAVHLRPSMTEFLSVLAACPALEDLALLKSGPKFNQEEINPLTGLPSLTAEPVHLRSLKFLELELEGDDINEAGYLITHISASSDTQLHVLVLSDPNDNIDISYLVFSSADFESPSHPIIREIRSLTFKIINDNSVSLCGYSQLDSPQSECDSAPLLSIQFQRSDPLRIFERCLTFPNIEDVILERFAEDIISTQSCITFLSRHPAITHITLSVCTDTSPLINAIISQSEICPKLESLSLEFLPVSFESLLDTLRKGERGRLKCLDIYHCRNVPEDSRDGLNGLVDEYRWDGPIPSRVFESYV